MKRGERLVMTAQIFSGWIRDVCEKHDIQMSVSKGWHRYTFYRGKRKIEWYPAQHRISGNMFDRDRHVTGPEEMATVIQIYLVQL